MIETLNSDKPKTHLPEDAVLVEGSLQGDLPYNQSKIPFRQYVVINNRLALVFKVGVLQVNYRYVLEGGKISHPYEKNIKVYPFLGTMRLPHDLSKIP